MTAKRAERSTDIARAASAVALIIQDSREEDVSATRTAYRILGHLGLCAYDERPDANPKTKAGIEQK